MSLKVNIPSQKTLTIQPAQTVSVPAGDINIRRIVDVPGEKRVSVFVDEIGQIDLDELSGSNYDSPANWTNADIQTAVSNYIAAN
jgi:hypothetical protein|tara:strand:+ start:180 stop:434 length:255 start_codon:yes stop_codon:yes gene_type:complete